MKDRSYMYDAYVCQDLNTVLTGTLIIVSQRRQHSVFVFHTESATSCLLTRNWF